jgi:hypothetical protein
MTRIKLRYVNEFVDQDGKVRRYFRRAGSRAIPLPGLPGSIEFMAAYQAALAIVSPPPPSPRHVINGWQLLRRDTSALATLQTSRRHRSGHIERRSSRSSLLTVTASCATSPRWRHGTSSRRSVPLAPAWRT